MRNSESIQNPLKRPARIMWSFGRVLHWASTTALRSGFQQPGRGRQYSATGKDCSRFPWVRLPGHRLRLLEFTVAGSSALY